jgi:phosphonate degradation associated HDIG domain protein
MTEDVVAILADLLTQQGQRQYGLHEVSQLEHALQSAWLAEQDGADPSLIAAALLHDIGHLIADLGGNPAEEGIDDRHEEIGYKYLARYFGPALTEPVRLHVAAKRYLCATEPGYFERLAPDSVLSLKLQGGPMSEAEQAVFRANPHAEAAVRLRRYDESAKVRDLETPPASHFLRLLVPDG